MAHLNISKIDIVFLKIAHEFLEVFFGRAVVTAMRPHSLKVQLNCIIIHNFKRNMHCSK